jgi:tetratricopeptide (TPR) repeat protein
VITVRTLPRMTAWALLLVSGVVLASGSARAQSAETPEPASPRAQLDEPVPEGNRPEDHPWTIGVSQGRQKRARALYQAGNRLLADSLFSAAVAKYRAALQHWNHPGIHYNLALALVSLDRPIEAYESVVEALRYGPDALQPNEYRRALDYRRMLRRQLAEVEVVCQEPGAIVTLDGKPLFIGPGRLGTLVLPGQHQLAASKPRYITTSQVVTLGGASRTRLELHLLAEHEATVRVRRWPSWTPWAVAGLGLGTGAAAAALHWQSDVNARRLNELVPVYCSQGCPTYPPVLRALHGRASWQRDGAYAGYATTAALLATGTLLAYLNRPQAVENRALHDLVQISLFPGGPEGSPGVSIHVPF